MCHLTIYVNVYIRAATWPSQYPASRKNHYGVLVHDKVKELVLKKELPSKYP